MNNDVDLSQLAIQRDDAQATSARRRRHLLTRYILPAALVLGLLCLIAWATRDFLFPAKPVKVIKVLQTRSAAQQEGTPLFKAAGWVQPRPTAVRVAALAPGVVDELLVVEDQKVKAGQRIALLVDEDARLELNRAKANLQLRDAELQAAQATHQSAAVRFDQPVQLQAPLAEAEAKLAEVETRLSNLPFELRRAEARLELAQRDLQGKIKAGGAVAGIAVAEARSELKAAAALVEELQSRGASLEKEKTALAARRDALRKKLELKADETQARDEAAANVKAAQARQLQARVALDEAQLQLDRMTVRAPIDGRVYHLVAQPGSHLMAGGGHTSTGDGSTVVTLYRPDKLQLRVDVRFEDLPRVQLGQPVIIESPAVSTPLAGRVLFISSLADIQKNTLEVKVAIDNPPPVFKPEMLMDVTFLAAKQPGDKPISSQQHRLYIPEQLLVRGEEGTFVWVADQAVGVARRVEVTAGRVGSNGLVEVTSGLTAASRLITVGREGLDDGTRIRITGEDDDLGASIDVQAPNSGSDSKSSHHGSH